MNDSRPQKPKRSWYQFRLRMVLLVGLCVFSGCGPSDEQQAVDAYNRGLACYHKGELGLAIADYTEALLLKPDDAEADFGRGDVYCDKGDFDKAVADYTEAMRLDPAYADAYHYRGLAFKKQGEQPKAEADFAKARELGYEPE